MMNQIDGLRQKGWVHKFWPGLLLLAIILCFVQGAQAQQWAQTYGGGGSEVALSIQRTGDGGSIVAGYTASFGAGSNDFWVAKLDATGAVTWQKTYGGTGDDVALSAQQTTDGGYIVAGRTTSFVVGNGNDVWILKLDASGNVTWQKTYGGTGDDDANAIQQTADGGYIVAGQTSSYGSGNLDFWVLKLDSTGAITWQKTYGGAANDEVAYSVQQTSDGGYIVAGRTSSFGAGLRDVWVLKLDSVGTVTWQKTYGGAGDDVGGTIKQTSDGGYILAGYTNSFGAGGQDIWILKLDSSGNVTWQKTYGGTGADSTAYNNAIQQTADGGYIVAGTTASFGAGSNDVWVLKLDASGNITWQRTYGGTGSDGAYAVQQTADGGYWVAGFTASSGAGGTDVWVLKLDASGNIPGCAGEGSSNATVTTTGVTPSSTAVTPANSTSASPSSNATITNTSMTPSQVCYFTNPVLAAIPTLSEWGLILLAGLLGLLGMNLIRRKVS